MREIKFKGKSQETNEWVCGQLLYLGNQPFIVGGLVEANSEYTNIEWWQPVYPNSVGRFTGLKNSQGNEIFEGDIVKFLYKPTYPFGDSEFDEVVICKVSVCVTGKFILEKNQSDEFEESLYNAVNYDDELTVIGNIHDNPELIKGEL